MATPGLPDSAVAEEENDTDSQVVDVVDKLMEMIISLHPVAQSMLIAKMGSALFDGAPSKDSSSQQEGSSTPKPIVVGYVDTPRLPLFSGIRPKKGEVPYKQLEA